MALATVSYAGYAEVMFLLWWMLACTSSAPQEGKGPSVSTTDVTDSVPSTGSLEMRTRLDGFPCAEGRDCAEGEPVEAGTCCVLGDALTLEQSSEGLEFTRVLEVEGHLLLSERYGLQVRHAETLDIVLERPFIRWKDVALGDKDELGQKVVFGFPQQYITDSEIWPSQVTVVRVDASGDVELLAERRFPDRSLRGVAWVDDVIYAGCGAAGICQFGADSLAWLRLSGPADVEYLAAGLGGLVAVTPNAIMLLEIAEDYFLRVVASAALSGQPMGVEVVGDEIWLALGGAGIEVLDANLDRKRRVDVAPGAYALSVDGERVAVSLWEEFALLDAQSGAVLDRQRIGVTEGQILGLSLRDERVLVAGWNRLSEWRYWPGRVAPEIRHDGLRIDGDGASVRVVNDGPATWFFEDAHATSGDLDTSWASTSLHPGEYVDWSVAGPFPSDGVSMNLVGTDPDGPLVWELPPVSETRLGVGDLLTDPFAPLVPEGSLMGYQGKVTLLAYFALY